MLKKNLKPILLVLGSTVISNAIASVDQINTYSYFNIDAQLGYATLVPMSSVKLPGTNLKHNGGVYGGVAVGYNNLLTNRFSLGLELGFNYGNKISSGTANGIRSTLDIINNPFLVTAKYALNEDNNIITFIKAGGVYSKQRCSNCLGCAGSCFRKVIISEIKSMAIIGVSKQASENTSVFAQYSHVFSTQWNHDYSRSSLNHGHTILSYNAFTLGVSLKI